MKKLLLLLAVFTLSYGADGSTHYPSPQMRQPPQKSFPPDCSHLSESEKAFAAQLSDMHRTMFCRHFSVSQRLRAMALVSPDVGSFAGKTGEITPDEAVEAVMKDARQEQPQARERSGQLRQGRPYSNYAPPSRSQRGLPPSSGR